MSGGLGAYTVAPERTIGGTVTVRVSAENTWTLSASCRGPESVLFFPVKSSIAPYLLGGVGWYSRNVEFGTLADTTPVDEATTRRFGYHAGLGGNLRLTSHIAMFGDYRYTFLHFGDDDETASSPRLIPFAGQLGLSNEGSMFTWGAMFYF